MTHWMGHSTDLPSSSNFLKNAIINSILTATSLKVLLISFLMIYRLTDFALVVL